jgi:hypothetical protein
VIARLVVLTILGVVVVATSCLYARSRALRSAPGAGLSGPVAAPATLTALLPDGGWLVVTTPWCAACSTATGLLAAHRPGQPVVTVDATTNSVVHGLEIQRVPTVLAISPTGDITTRLVGIEAVRSHLHSAATQLEQTSHQPSAVRNQPGTFLS